MTRSTSGSSASRCQTMCGLVPVIFSTATATSRSQLDPGKTTTAVFMASALYSAEKKTRMSLGQVDRVILDHGVGQQLVAHGARRFPGLGRVGLGQIQFDILALADLLDAGEAQRDQGMADGGTLRI